MIWPLLTLLTALLSACVAWRRLGPANNGPLGWLVVLVLFGVYHLLPVHIVAGAEIAGLIDHITYPIVTAVGALGLAATLALPRSPARPDPARDRPPLMRVPGYIVGLAVVCVASWLIFSANAFVSYAFGWDSLTYHLPLAASWLQTQSLAIPPSAHWQYSMPANGNIGLMMLLTAGLERLTFLPSAVAYAMSAISVWLLARRLTANAEAALLATILFVMLPMVQFHATGAYVDLFGAGFILAGAAIFAWRNAGGDAPTGARWYVTAVALAGLAWGIAIGTKPIFYAYGGLFAIGALVIIWRERGGGYRLPLALAALLATCMLVPSAFWFLRALEATGNPIFPIPVRLLGWTIFEGQSLDFIVRGNPEQRFVSSTLAWLTYPWVEFKDNGYAYGFSSGLGPGWAAFVPPGLLFAAYVAIRRRHAAWARECAALIVLFAVLMILWWVGLRRLPRFGLPILAVSCVLATPLFAFLLERRGAAVKTLFVLSVVVSTTFSTFVPAHELLGKVRSGAWSRNAVFEIPDFFDRLPAGSVIWNGGAWELWNFALMGAKLSNRVLFRRCWRVPDYAAFIAQHKIDYLVEFIPYRCGEVQNLGARRVFEGWVGPSYKWRVWAVSAKAKKAAE